ncbi:MAG TPA: glycoside hydrolase family 6 protein [Mycobacteriales bacterium]|nr:glycoside hydrolase family 6 protein [Mycobacteriales bacterium]
MSRSLPLRAATALVAAATATTVMSLSTAAIAGPSARGPGHTSRAPAANTRFFTPPPNPGAVAQVAGLRARHDTGDAALLRALVSVPQAVWFTGGTPQQVRRDVHRTVTRAAAHRQVPVLVAYDIPFRDCAQFSAGGAADTASYLAWIDGFASGIGNRRAVVLLEPDSLGIIPNNIDINGNPESCQVSGPGADPQTRYAQLNAAVDRFERQPNVGLYLDGTHSAWLGTGDIAQRLVRAGVDRAQGFFLNVSNYQATPQLTEYGTWISECMAFATNPADGGWRLGHYDFCASQYFSSSAPNDGLPGDAVDPNDISTWHWTDDWFTANLGTAVPTTHFVLDTSRNGQGPNDMSAFAALPFNQPAGVVNTLHAGNWCNAPDSGVGLRPTADTGNPLIDAYLWVKIPGESDGTCDVASGVRAWDFTASNPFGLTGDAQLHADPLWGATDPAAGGWFGAQALQLAQRANPPLAVPTHHGRH